MLQPEPMEYALTKFELELEERLNSVSGEIDTRRKRMEALDVELARLAEAVAIHGANTALMKAIADSKSERRATEQILWALTSGSVQAALAGVREFALKLLHQIRGPFMPNRRLPGLSYRSTSKVESS